MVIRPQMWISVRPFLRKSYALNSVAFATSKKCVTVTYDHSSVITTKTPAVRPQIGRLLQRTIPKWNSPVHDTPIYDESLAIPAEYDQSPAIRSQTTTTIRPSSQKPYDPTSAKNTTSIWCVTPRPHGRHKTLTLQQAAEKWGAFETAVFCQNFLSHKCPVTRFWEVMKVI